MPELDMLNELRSDLVDEGGGIVLSVTYGPPMIERMIARLKQMPLRRGPQAWTDKEILFWCRHFNIDVAEVERNA